MPTNFCTTSQQLCSSVGLITSKAFLYVKTVTWWSDADNDARQWGMERGNSCCMGGSLKAKCYLSPSFRNTICNLCRAWRRKVTREAWLTRRSYLPCYFILPAALPSWSYPEASQQVIFFVFFHLSFSICLICCAFLLHRWHSLLWDVRVRFRSRDLNLWDNRYE